MERLKKIAAKFAAPFKKITIMAAYQAFSWIFDNPIWLGALSIWGNEAIPWLILVAVGLNFVMLLIHRKKKVSWLLWVDAVEKIKKNRVKVFWSWGIFWISVLGISFPVAILIFLLTIALEEIFFILLTYFEKTTMFLVLSLWQDSFIATAYLRSGQENGLSKRDWKIFIASSAISIVYWVWRNGLITSKLIKPSLY